MATRNCLYQAVAAVMLLTTADRSQATTFYAVTDLGTLSGPISSANNLSGNGQIAGLSILTNGNFHAMLWNGSPIDIGTIGADTQSCAFAVNDAGQVVGVSYNYGDLSPHAFLWAAGVLTSLGTFSPHDINNAGVIAGHTTIFNAASLWVDHPCIWTSGIVTELPTLGGHNGQAMALNSTGAVAGQSMLADNLTVRACVWMNGVGHDLATLAGTALARSATADVNDDGQVVGWSETATGEPHATLFQIDASGNVTMRIDLGVLANGNSYALGVNNGGIVVGVSDARGFTWQSGTMTDLNSRIASTSGWTITRASAINDSGVIVGEAARFGFGRAVMLTPADCLKADMNFDSQIDGTDIAAFIHVMLDGGTPQQTCAGDAALPNDGAVTLEDVAPFVHCLLNGGCG